MLNRKNKGKPVKEADDRLECLQKLKGLILELQLAYEKTTGAKINKDVLGICKTTRKIYQSLIDDSSKISKQKLFIDYYLPESIGILNRYAAIKANKFTGDQAITTAALIEEFIPKLKIAFDKILEDMTVQSGAATEIDIKILIDELYGKRLL